MELKSEQTQKMMSTSSEPVGRPLYTSSPVTNKKPKWVPPGTLEFVTDRFVVLSF